MLAFGPGVIAEHLSTVKVYMDKVQYPHKQDQASKGVPGKVDFEKKSCFSLRF